MSDSRSRRSHSHRNESSSTSRRRSSRNLQTTSSSRASRSSTSLRSTSGSGNNNSSSHSSRSSGGGASSNNNSGGTGSGSNNGGTGEGSGAHPVYGSLGAAAAGGSRYSLTDQFSATRSVYDFGFDDAASSIFDSSSIFSVETVRGAGTFPSYDLAGSDTSDAVMVGYSTVLEAEEEDEDDLQLTPQTTPTRQRRSGEGDQGEDEKQSLQQPEELSSPIQQPSPFQQRLQQLQEDEELLRTPVADPTLLQLQKRPVKRTYYELLCLSRRPAPRPAQIRAAYYRLFRLLNSDNSARRIAAVLQPTAALYFAQVQVAFETLIDPIRRLEYDHRLDDLEDEEGDGSSDTDSENGGDAEVDEAVEAASAGQRQQALLRKQELQTSTDVGVRFDASRALLPPQLQRDPGSDDGSSAVGSGAGSGSLPAFDYTLKQVVRVGLPSMGRYTQHGLEHLQRRVAQSQRLLQDKYGITVAGVVPSTAKFRPWPIRCGIPVLSLSASTYAVTATGDITPLVDRYQPLLPEVLGPNRIAQLANTRSTGHIVLAYRQEFWGPFGSNGLLPTVAEVETEILPRVAITTRVSHAVPLPADGAGLGSDEPLHVEVMVQSGRSYLPSASPRIGLGLSRRMGIGHYFLCADSGNRWSSAAASYVPTIFAPLVAPMVEVGYSVGPQEMGLHSGIPLTGPADRGLKGAEADLDVLGTSSSRGTWTVSTAINGNSSIAAYLRYGRTLFLVPWRRLGKKTPRDQRGKTSGAIRVEAELSADRFADGYLAVRGLAPVRWFGFLSRWTNTTTPSYTQPKLGLEVAMSAGSGSVHVSLYWSRANQRIKLPFLLLPAAHSNVATNIFFCAAILPVAAMAGLEFTQIYLRAKRREKRRKKVAADKAAAAASDGSEVATDEYDPDEEQAITSHRAEADELTMLLASAVDAAQNANPKESKEQKENSLVIISAKYGVALADEADGSEDNDNDGGYGYDDTDSVNSLFGERSATPSTVILAPAMTATASTTAKKATAMATRNGWAPDYEVADVTSAVAALVVAENTPVSDKQRRRSSVSATAPVVLSYSEHLLIPRGLRKSRLLGFWDPAPHYEEKRWQLRQQYEQTGQNRGRAFARKVLHVRYRWHGQEHIAEVGDRDELRLP